MKENATYIWEPDVAFYKGRVVQALFANHFPQALGFLSHAQGFFFSPNPPPEDFPGRAFLIKSEHLYKPKALRTLFKKEKTKRIEIIQRNFPFPVKDIRKQVNLSAGGDTYLIASRIGDEKKVWITERIR